MCASLVAGSRRSLRSPRSRRPAPSLRLVFACLSLTALIGCGPQAGDGDTADSLPPSDSDVVDTSVDPCNQPVDCLPDFDELASFGASAIIVFSESAAYVADPDAGAIFEVPFPAGPSRKLVDSPVVGSLGAQSSVATIAVGSGRVFYNTVETVVIDTQVVEQRQLRSFTLPDGPETVLADVDDSLGIAVRGAEVFYRDRSLGYNRAATGWLRRSSDGTGDVTPFGVLSTMLLFDDSGNVYLDYYQSSPSSIALAVAAVGDPPADSTPPDPPVVTILTQGFQHMANIQISGGRAFFCDSTLFTTGIAAPAVATEMALDGRTYSCGGYAVREGALYARAPMSNGVKVITKYDALTGVSVGPIASPASSGEPRYVSGEGLFAVKSTSGERLSYLALP